MTCGAHLCFHGPEPTVSIHSGVVGGRSTVSYNLTFPSQWRRFRRRRIRHGGDLQGGVICRRCNAKSVNLAGGELRGGEIGAVILSAEISEAVKCGAPRTDMGTTDYD